MIGQLSNALLRDCRFLSAIGMHTGSMTQQQSFDLFRNQCFQDEGNARQQAARGTYDPAYLNYTMGKLMIRKLRDDWAYDAECPASSAPTYDWRGQADAWQIVLRDHVGRHVRIMQPRMVGLTRCEGVAVIPLSTEEGLRVLHGDRSCLRIGTVPSRASGWAWRRG